MKTFKEFLLMEEELKDSEKSVSLNGNKLKEIPKQYHFNKVKGSFYCDNNSLTSLKGSPKIVTMNFDVGINLLTSLEYSPEEVGQDFHCNNNRLASLEGSTEKVGGKFFCNYNRLTSLKGIPKEIGGKFFCEYNPDLFEVSPILSSKIEGKIYYTPKGDDDVSIILNKYKNNPRNLIKMLVELKKINERFC